MEPKTFINHPEDLMSWRVNKNYVHTSIYGKLLKISSDYKSYDKTSELLPTPVMDPRSKGLCLDTISPCQQKPVRRGGRRRNPNWVFFKNLPNPISLQGIGNPWRVFQDSNSIFLLKTRQMAHFEWIISPITPNGYPDFHHSFLSFFSNYQNLRGLENLKG